MGGSGGCRGRGQGGCERRIEVFVKIQKKNLGGGVRRGGRGGGVGLGDQSGCEQRIEKKIFLFVGGGGGGGGSRWGGRGRGQSGCERRIEVFVKIQK